MGLWKNISEMLHNTKLGSGAVKRLSLSDERVRNAVLRVETMEELLQSNLAEDLINKIQ